MMSEPSQRPNHSIKVILADDQTVVRAGLRMVLEAEPDLEVIAEAGDVPETLRKLRAHRPDVLLLGLNMPGEPSLTALPQLREASPGTKIVVLTMENDPAFAREALQAGAGGYVLKESAAEETVHAVRNVLDGRPYLNPQLGAKIAAAPPGSSGPPDDLSERELEVLRLIAFGHTNSEIAGSLYLSVRTIESHRAHIQQKLRLSTRAQLVKYALDHGLMA
jgi:two-component system response regulator NreC